MIEKSSLLKAVTAVMIAVALYFTTLPLITMEQSILVATVTFAVLLWLNRGFKIVIAIGVSVLLYLLTSPLFTTEQATLIALIGFLVTLWTNEGLELGVVSLLPLLLFPTFGILEFNDVTPNYSKSIIYLFIGGFLLAIGMQKTGLHEKIAHSILSIFPSSVRGTIYALSITAGLISGILTDTTVTILLVPIAMFLSRDPEIQFRLILSVAYGSLIGGVMTPIGTAPNMIYLGFAEQHGLEAPNFIGWVGQLLPVVVIMLTIIPYILSLGVQDKKFERKDNFNSSLNLEQKKVLYIMVGTVLLLLLNSPLQPYYSGLGLNEKMILLGAGVSLFLPRVGILNWNDMKDFPYGILFLFGASFSIATAFTKTGLAEAITDYLMVFEGLPMLLMITLIVAFVAFSTEVTSNTALTSVSLPVIYAFVEKSGISNGSEILLMATVVASFAFMLPIATPPNAIAVSTGKVKISRMAKTGLLLNIIGITVLVAVGQIFWI